ncbi:xylan 1,4-beta-xylosidase [Polymorphospora rubra]|uniref:GH39 family glycosyl hydrolase n=1 Tax=Polymorphospora rubra TaxID=338584 RepID=UPI0033D9212F
MSVASAQASWSALMGAGGAQDREPGEMVEADLPAPTGVRAVAGRDQVTVSWDPVPAAIGYVVYRAGSAEGPFEVVDFGGGDVLAVPHGPFADTTDGRGGWYAVAALATVAASGPLSAPVRVGPGPADARVTVEVGSGTVPLHRVWRAMVGSEHLSHLLSEDLTGGRVIGTDLSNALRRVHDELGVATVRAHGILCDDLAVVRPGAYDFSGVDRVYDAVLALGYRPVVELGFMPRELARDPSRTVFTYAGIISPPKDPDGWADLVRALVAHLVDRYGRDEVRDNWAFEVWNEANLSVFWSGTPDEYWRLYEVTARAVKDVDPGIAVGGPGSAAVGWIDGQLAVDAPVDFLSTHVYGTPPLDLRPLADGRPLLWTEWGVTPTHHHPINDTVFAATFLLRGMRSAAGRVAALAPWVASDHFEELGRPERLLHGGFGLLTVGNLAKPKFWALKLAERLGEVERPVTLTGDGAGSLVEAWAGGSGVLVWNGTLDQSRMRGAAGLDRLVTVRFTGVAPGPQTVRVWRVDDRHGNIGARWASLGGGADWPDDEQWLALAAEDRLDEAEPARTVTADADGTVSVEINLPMPGIAYLELS